MTEEKQLPRELISSLTHLIGALSSIAGLAILVSLAAARDASPWHIVSFAIFGASLILTYGTSAAYHLTTSGSAKKETLRRLDHATIYILIAGTYTPVSLVPLRGGWGWSLFGAVWGIGLIGAVWKLAGWRLPPALSGVSYLLLGWLIIIAIVPLLQSVPLPAFWWLFAGGMFYTIGVIFFGLGGNMPAKRWFGMHEIFHLFVMAGSFAHFWMMLKYIMRI
ncbi:hypothetical protein A3D54_00835 [Candidatus Falkowbacteria bacterium RIFCSPHIGHO2_02_FULL_45_15]|uniref:Hemolysin n=1 Tax=Candidatus Falkowbacteria bacterium RIFCSPHIGHO2_02_FULL_45_15 TaxID=1797987 RepID=A0A1F5RXP0_9BACT|nr:MAG: hypothetical protein A3D54_00835 [Candidatus Falkowbacteria bacterium RIFCSPHIGHO2_02_FULL_45_15]